MNATDIFSNKEIEELILKGYLFESEYLDRIQHIEKLTEKGYLYVSSDSTKSDKTNTKRYYADKIVFMTKGNIYYSINEGKKGFKKTSLHVCYSSIKLIYPSCNVDKEEGIRFYRRTISQLAIQKKHNEIHKYESLYEKFTGHSLTDPKTEALDALAKLLDPVLHPGIGTIILVPKNYIHKYPSLSKKQDCIIHIEKIKEGDQQ